MARYRIDLPEHGEDAGIDVQLDGDAKLTPEMAEAFRALANAAFAKMDEEAAEVDEEEGRPEGQLFTHAEVQALRERGCTCGFGLHGGRGRWVWDYWQDCAIPAADHRA